jgi:hypothetical protein
VAGMTSWLTLPNPQPPLTVTLASLTKLSVEAKATKKKHHEFTEKALRLPLSNQFALGGVI